VGTLPTLLQGAVAVGELGDEVAVITGGEGGIGIASAELIAREGTRYTWSSFRRASRRRPIDSDPTAPPPHWPM
jgi:NAD(P)-dependent dehydrogenase (short-subunit alcohol dehydrogenase family)